MCSVIVKCDSEFEILDTLVKLEFKLSTIVEQITTDILYAV